jgi:hypothetical protein
VAGSERGKRCTIFQVDRNIVLFIWEWRPAWEYPASNFTDFNFMYICMKIILPLTYILRRRSTPRPTPRSATGLQSNAGSVSSIKITEVEQWSPANIVGNQYRNHEQIASVCNLSKRFSTSQLVELSSAVNQEMFFVFTFGSNRS